MTKTIDIEGSSGEGWPPKGFQARFKDKPPVAVMTAAGVAALILLVGAMMAISGRLGVANIDSKEVGVVVNYLTGSEEVVTQPGYKLYLPFVQEVFIFDKSQQKFLMQGTDALSANHVPRLTVRASDGSSFWFEELQIQYEIAAGAANVLLHDSGPGVAFKQEWVKAHARSILRDEFGRFSAVEAANPTVFELARTTAKERLNQYLNPHGIRVVLIGTPNPKFDALYEEAIEERKSADQEVERLAARTDQLEQEKLQRLARVEREKSVEMQTLEGELVKKERENEVDAIQIEKSADAFAARRRAEGEALRSEYVARARGLTEKYTKEAEGLHSKALALEQRGEVVVREALIEKLMNIRFTLVPYSRDAAPKRLEHVDARGNEALIDESVTGDDR
ncbi:MAG: hypothetical protein GY711_28480 [bacterium]|nr:hypothetical protein [bacterium]